MRMSLRPLAIAALFCLAAPQSGAQAAAGWRDLNHNGRPDPYENPTLPDAARVADLLSRMTIEEKVGTMLHGSLPAQGAKGGGGWGTAYDRDALRRLVARGVTSFITRLSTDPAQFAAENNAAQEIAAAGRLGIPLTISTDPRHHFQEIVGAASAAGGFSQWPEPLGFAALADEKRVERFGAIAAREYRAVGIHMALSPQADLYSEPRWPRGTATFGDDPALVSRLVGAYVRGFQGGRHGVSRTGVATIVKHWVGYGAEPDGFDAHNFYGQAVTLDDKALAQHVAAFDGAFAAGVTGVMPTYAILTGVTYRGKPLPPVGAGFNPVVLRDMLRRDKGYSGLILSDWAITNDCRERCQMPNEAVPQDRDAIGMPWGVEGLTKEERFVRGVKAGIDQFGGTDDPAPLLAAVRTGKVSVKQVDDAVRRILLLKFRLGLFDHAFVNAPAAARIVGSPAFRQAGERAQEEAQVLLKNRSHILPLGPSSRRVWLYGVDRAAAAAAGFVVVDRIEQADVAIVRLQAPFERLHPYNFFGSVQHEGRLDFRPDDPGMAAFERASITVPTVVAVDLDRPAILTALEEKAAAVIGLFGASDLALLRVVSGAAMPKGRLPIELPSSMASVIAQSAARPNDSRSPLFPRGASLSATWLVSPKAAESERYVAKPTTKSRD